MLITTLPVQQIDVSFTSICPVSDHKICHNIVKVTVDPRGDSQLDQQTTLTFVMTKFIVNNMTDTLKTDINLFFNDHKLWNCQLLFFDVSHK